MSFLYVNEQGATIGIEGGYFSIKQKNGLVTKMAKESLESITVFGNVSISTPCTRECLTRGIPINYFSTTGIYFGKVSSTRHTKGVRLKNQVYASDNLEFSLGISKKMIHAKISNQIVVLRRYKRNSDADISMQIQRMELSKNKIERCTSVEEVMGFEGNAAREYFLALANMVDEEFRFKGRSEQPPKDPFNSMLSLGYTILMYEVYNEIENRGLTPYIGFLHAIHDKHPTLASDMMEEWRAIIVDAVVMSLVQGHEIKTSHFYQDDESGGIFLNHDGMKLFINKIENKFRSNANYLCTKQNASNFRRGIYLQSLAMAKAVEACDPQEYIPIYIR